MLFKRQLRWISVDWHPMTFLTLRDSSGMQRQPGVVKEPRLEVSGLGLWQILHLSELQFPLPYTVRGSGWALKPLPARRFQVCDCDSSLFSNSEECLYLLPLSIGPRFW